MPKIDEERYWAFRDAPTRSWMTSEVLTQLKFIVATWDTRWAQDVLGAGTSFSDMGWDAGAMRDYRRLVNFTFGIALAATPAVVKPAQKLSDYRKLVNAELLADERLTQ